MASPLLDAVSYTIRLPTELTMSPTYECVDSKGNVLASITFKPLQLRVPVLDHAQKEIGVIHLMPQLGLTSAKFDLCDEEDKLMGKLVLKQFGFTIGFGGQSSRPTYRRRDYELIDAAGKTIGRGRLDKLTYIMFDPESEKEIFRLSLKGDGLVHVALGALSKGAKEYEVRISDRKFPRLLILEAIVAADAINTFVKR